MGSLPVELPCNKFYSYCRSNYSLIFPTILLEVTIHYSTILLSSPTTRGNGRQCGDKQAPESTAGQPMAVCRQGIYVEYPVEYSKCCALNGILMRRRGGPFVRLLVEHPKDLLGAARVFRSLHTHHTRAHISSNPSPTTTLKKKKHLCNNSRTCGGITSQPTKNTHTHTHEHTRARTR